LVNFTPLSSSSSTFCWMSFVVTMPTLSWVMPSSLAVARMVSAQAWGLAAPALVRILMPFSRQIGSTPRTTARMEGTKPWAGFFFCIFCSSGIVGSPRKS